MKRDSKAPHRFRYLFYGMSIAAIYILWTAAYTMVWPDEQRYWTDVSKRFVRDNIPIAPMRGNILSSNGELLAGSIPEFRLYMDFVVIEKDSAKRTAAQAWRDSAYFADLDSIATGLARIFPDKSAKWFKDNLKKGKAKGSHAWRIYPRNASYIQYQACRQLPLLRETSIKGGFYTEEIIQRKQPYGSLAARTVGDLYRNKDSAKCGIELSYDSILRGKQGVGHNAKVLNKRVRFVDVKPVNGHDLVTTIDVGMQDAAEKALRKMLTSLDGTKLGVAIVMEVATGDIKAIANLSRAKDGNFYEMENHALSKRMEPGSTFKTASIMVGLEDGVIKKNGSVNCVGGQYHMHGRTMKDHNWHKGGYGVLSVSEVLEQSSNIGVSRLIDQAYHHKPQDYVDGLRRLGVGEPLNLHFVGERDPIISQPNSKKRYWSKTDLAWMSIGYVTQLAPIHTLAFYNGIANNGRMVKPRFVKAEMENGVVVREFPTEVVREQMCSQHTLDDIHDILEKVVSRGLGRRAGNGGKLFKVSGKTGTAQIAAEGGRGYHSGVAQYLVTFCGYYPSDAPRYSTIVCIVKSGLPASGGGHCGPVFREISEYVMTKDNQRQAQDAADSTSVFAAPIAPGDAASADVLAEFLDLGKASTAAPAAPTEGHVPDVQGMGARTAIQLLRQQGLRPHIHGAGHVTSQSPAAGTACKRGKAITLKLQ